VLKRNHENARRRFASDSNATFAVEPLPVEYNEALQHAKAIYDFVLTLLPSAARP
jgi:hypothetical protein